MSGDAATIEQAREALAAGDWPVAYERLAALEPSALSATDLEDFADAAWWVSKPVESLDLRHKAYAAYAADGDDARAGVVAARIAIEHFSRDEPSIAAGFLARAHRHAEGMPDGRELGLFTTIEANVARYGGELDRSLELSRRGLEIGRRVGDADVTALAIHTEGLTLLAAGRVREALALLDEAMALVVAGDVGSFFTGVIYCNVISACLELGDVRRAGEWNDAAKIWCDTLPPGSPFPGMCRVNRAEVARLRGAWKDAEAEASLATAELADVDPEGAAAAFSQLGEVRRRTGDLAGAEAAFARAQELGADPNPGLALLRLAQRKADAALSALQAALSGEPPVPRRVRLLAARVETALAAGAIADARAAADDLAALSAGTDLPAFAAAVATARGSVALAAGDSDLAVGELRRAAATWQELRLPYETACARVLLGRALRTTGDEDGASAELTTALASFERLGAIPDVEATGVLLHGPAELPGGLTAREAEVLRLVAAGKTNRDIAVELVISEHTVGRHLQNMFAKLGVSSRAAATAYAFEHGLN